MTTDNPKTWHAARFDGRCIVADHPPRDEACANDAWRILADCGPADDSDAAKRAKLFAQAPTLAGWLYKAVQLAQQQRNGGDDAPLPSTWQWFIDEARAALARADGVMPR